MTDLHDAGRLAALRMVGGRDRQPVASLPLGRAANVGLGAEGRFGSGGGAHGNAPGFWTRPSLQQRAASFCQYGTRLDLLRDSFDLAPFPHQGAPAPRVALIGQTKADDPIRSKVPIVLAQLAPRRQHSAAIEEAEHDRPDRPSRALALGVDIPEDELALRADRLP